MNSVSGRFTPKSRMVKALVYTLLPRLSRYVLDGRYDIDSIVVDVLASVCYIHGQFSQSFEGVFYVCSHQWSH